MKPTLKWHRESVHPLEFRAAHNGSVLIVRTTRGKGLVQWEAVVYRDDRPVETTVHPDYFRATAWAEEVAT